MIICVYTNKSHRTSVDYPYIKYTKGSWEYNSNIYGHSEPEIGITYYDGDLS